MVAATAVQSKNQFLMRINFIKNIIYANNLNLKLNKYFMEHVQIIILNLLKKLQNKIN